MNKFWFFFGIFLVFTGFGTILGILLGAIIFGIAKEAFFYIPGIDGSFYRVFLGAVLVSAALTNENIRKRIIGSI